MGVTVGLQPKLCNFTSKTSKEREPSATKILLPGWTDFGSDMYEQA